MPSKIGPSPEMMRAIIKSRRPKMAVAHEDLEYDEETPRLSDEQRKLFKKVPHAGEIMPYSWRFNK